MKITDVIFMGAVPSMSFYGAVYGNELSIIMLVIYVCIMLLICLVAIYYIDHTESGNKYIKNYDISKSNHGTLKQKIGYVLIISSACLLVSYDHVLLGVLLVVPIFVNEYIADRIIDANQQKA
jgi:hypothetical protein